MANTIQIKRSGTTSQIPTSLAYGELAINYADGKLYYRNSSDAIVQFSAAPASASLNDLTDVSINSVADQHVLKYSSASGWVNGPITILAPSSLTLSTTSSTTDAVIFWDSTNKKIKVGNGTISLDFTSSNLITNSQVASYTLVLADKDKLIEMNVASANTVTIPTNTSVAFPIGSQITILQVGAGQTTLVAGSGVTVNATPGLKLRAQWSSVTLIKRGTDTWVALGDLQA
jgi:hypothetical protein